VPRYRLTLEYDGTGFVGWQRQSNGYSVQQALEEAVTGFTGIEAVVHGAGRTDAGVHALGQVAHVDLPREYPSDTVRDALNAHLRPHPIAVLEVSRVDEEFHARFSAVARHYRYRIICRMAPLTLSRHKAWLVRGDLDAGAMHKAAQLLVGKHDFTTFRAVQCQAKSPVKTLERLEVSRQGEVIDVFASAPSFLHHQVRSIVGSLKLVGEGKWSAAELKAVLDAADRRRCGPVAPADGLYLLSVDYPDGTSMPP
jgi:tRNA pseudouridine38-40 synthase